VQWSLRAGCDLGACIQHTHSQRSTLPLTPCQQLGAAEEPTCKEKEDLEKQVNVRGKKLNRS